MPTLLIANFRVSDRDKDHECVVVVAFADAGFVVVETKGSRVWCADARWWIKRRGKDAVIDPVGQAREARYALRTYICNDPRWGSRGHVRWAHAVVLPFTPVDDDLAMPDAQRWQVAGRDDLHTLATSYDPSSSTRSTTSGC